jgi:hypothetical protein
VTLPVELRRDEYLDGYFDYGAGQHILCVAPTGAGKSWLMWQLLERAMRQQPQLAPLVAMPKHTDPTTVAGAARLGLRETPVWPPQPKLFQAKPRGYVIWPKHPHGPGIDTEARRQVVGSWLKKGMEEHYWRGNSINFVDDAHSAASMMDLNPLIEEMLVNGRSGGAGVWLATQKPSGTTVSGGLTSFAYNSASHLFFSKDDDPRNLDRLAEIGGAVDVRQMKAWISGLRRWRIDGNNVGEFLAVDKSGPYFARILPW